MLTRSIAIVICILIIITPFLHYSHKQLLDDRKQKYQTINPLVAENTLFIGDEEDYLYLGEHLNTNFDKSGYINVHNLRPNVLHSTNANVYLMELSYSSRNDRPTSEMITLLNELKDQDKLELIYSRKNINIYKYIE
jgi:hypothetical protein